MEYKEKIEGYQGTNVTIIFTHPVDLFLVPYFDQFFTNFQNEADCLGIDSLIDRETQSDYFSSRDLISGFHCRIQVKFLRSMQRVYFFYSPGIVSVLISNFRSKMQL